ncbi:MAG: phytoene desaturase family protein [Bacteroidia bacterium]
MSKKKAVVIGAGFAGMSAACYLAKDGFEVTVLEKNEMAGGRARKFEAEGFVFDMGPSWYWMPDIFEKFFADFNKKPSDYYQLKRLSPSYSVYFDDGKAVNIPSDMQELKNLFEQYEKGSGEKLEQFLNDAAYKYNVGINDLVHKPGVSIMEFASIDLMRDVMRLNVFKSFYKHAREYFSHPHLLQLLEFPVLFLGATAQNTPALYSLMNYADMQLGTWYPMGGMFEIVKGMKVLAESLSVNFVFNSAVTNFEYNNNGNIKYVSCNSKKYEADVVIGSADYNFLDTKVLKEKRNYSDKYWNSRTMAPSCLLFYLGVDKKINNLEHHNLFFDKDFTKHAFEIYEEAKWPSDPLFYVCAPSKTDNTIAPDGKENLFLLMPVAIGLEDNEEVREKYYNVMMERLEALTGEKISEHVIYKKSYAQSNFIADYNSFKGNAYGLANTLKQTAILKPSIRSKKIKNLFFAGQLTVPGPGVPPSLISGKVAAALVKKMIN